MAEEPRIRARRFSTEDGEIRLGTFDSEGRFRPLTLAEAAASGVGIADYDPKTGKVG